MKPSTRKWASGLLATTALGGGAGGIAIERERALDKYIVEALANAEDPKTEFAARRTLEAIKVTKPAYVELLKANAQAAADPTNADKKKAVAEAEQQLQSFIRIIYQGRDFTAPIASMKAQVEISKQAFEIRHPVQTSVLPLADVQSQAQVIYEPGKSPVYRISTSLGALDVLSQREQKFVHAHEAAHLANDYMDSGGRPKIPDHHHITKDGRLARKPIVNLKQEIKDAVAVETNADRGAILQTCDPQAAASALASSQALSQGMTPNDLRLQIHDQLSVTPGNLARYLYEAATQRTIPVVITKDRKQFVELPHPHWKDRVAAVVKTAKENCPTR